MSKDKVLSVLNQRINQSDTDARKLEKEFVKQGGNMKSFLD